MTDEEFDAFLGSAIDELREKQEKLKSEYGFGEFARWFFDQETEKLELFDHQDNKVIVAEVINIGSFASNSNTWKWAWSNDSVLPHLRKLAEPLKELGSITGLAMFESDSAFSIDGESMAWEVAAICVRHLNALGVYRAPSSSRPLAAFLALTSVRRVQ
jgi:hypothetical protein